MATADTRQVGKKAAAVSGVLRFVLGRRSGFGLLVLPRDGVPFAPVLRARRLRQEAIRRPE